MKDGINRRSDVLALLAEPPSEKRSAHIKRAIKLLEEKRDNIERFVNWPALVASFDKDIAMLKAAK